MSHGELMIEPGFRARSCDAEACTFHHCCTASHWGVCVQLCPTLCDPMDPTRLLCPWDFSGKNTGDGCHFLLQRIFSTDGSNPHLLCLLYWQADSLPLHHLGSSQVLMYKLYFLSFYAVFLLSYFVYIMKRTKGHED